MPHTTRDHFDAVAHSYTERGWVTSTEIRNHILSSFPIICEDARVLELGIGTGEFLKGLIGNNMLHVGLDLSRNMLDQARQLVPTTALVQGNMEALPFCTSSFDMVACRKALRFCDLRAALTEAHRVSRQNGYLFFAETCAVDSQHKALIDRMIAMTEPHQRPFHTVSSFNETCEEVGFSLRRSELFTEPRILTKAYCRNHYCMPEAQVTEYWRFLTTVPEPLRSLNGLKVINDNSIEVLMHWIVVLGVAVK